jgi:hypothetical protein
LSRIVRVGEDQRQAALSVTMLSHRKVGYSCAERPRRDRRRGEKRARHRAPWLLREEHREALSRQPSRIRPSCRACGIAKGAGLLGGPSHRISRSQRAHDRGVKVRHRAHRDRGISHGMRIRRERPRLQSLRLSTQGGFGSGHTDAIHRAASRSGASRPAVIPEDVFSLKLSPRTTPAGMSPCPGLH